MNERRRVVRQKSFLRGNIQFNNGRNSADCLIRDITAYGARLVCSDAIGTPDVIDVYIPQKDQTFRAHVIWRHGQDMGVAFTQAAAFGVTDRPREASDLVTRVERLENELAAMKRMLRRLKMDVGTDADVA